MLNIEAYGRTRRLPQDLQYRAYEGNRTMNEIQQKQSENGRLVLAATPIGNLEDMTFRAVRAMKEADLIAAEDTRNSIRLLNHFGIHTPLTSYHEYNKIEKAYELIGEIRRGKTVVLITDAGTPGISDPGEDLVRIAYEEGVEVTSLPGACACITALTLSGLPTRRFCFEAFLPYAKKERQAVLKELGKETRTIILYEAPHHLTDTLKELLEALGDRRVSLCRELTKIHEEVWQTTLREAIRTYTGAAPAGETPAGAVSAGETPVGAEPVGETPAGAAPAGEAAIIETPAREVPARKASTGEEVPRRQPRGEYVLVIEGLDRKAVEEEKQREWESISLEEHMQMYLEQGLDRKSAMKSVAKDRGIPKREVYRMLLE